MIERFSSWRFALGSLALLSLFTVVPALAVDASGPPLDRAEQALAEGRPRDALDLLRPYENPAEVDTRFNYTLALAAMDAGEPAIAERALRRVLAVEPRFDGARLDLARALAAQGDRDGAAAELRAVISNSPAAMSREAARAALERLSVASADAGSATAPSSSRQRQRWRWVPALTLGAGHDSNANASTSDREFFGFSLTPQAVERESAFIDAGASLLGERQIAPGLASVQLRAGHRSYPSAHFVDQSSVLGAAALTWPLHGWVAAAGIGGSFGWLDGRAHLATVNAEVSVSRRIAGSWELAGLARAGVVDYRQPLFEELDARRYLWGAALQRLDLLAGRARVGVALLGGRDEVQRRGSPWSNDRYGARLFGAWQFGAQGSLYGEASWLTSDYFGARGFFGIDRLDRQVVALVGLEWRDLPARGWSVAPQLRWTDNPSNLALFGFDRVELSLYLRREFR